MATSRNVALLRGINVGSTRSVPMARLREVCAELGWQDVKTYIQSGNVVFTGSAAGAAAALEKAILEEFGLEVPVVLKGAAEWKKLIAANPFEGESAKEPSRVMLVTSQKKPAEGAAAAVEAKATSGERALLGGGGLWIHFPQGAGKSKITPALLDKAMGSPATMRNLNTVLEIAALL